MQTVGIDRVIEQAGVAKASLYNTFGSKEALVEAYLEGRRVRIADRVTRHVSALRRAPATGSSRSSRPSPRWSRSPPTAAARSPSPPPRPRRTVSSCTPRRATALGPLPLFTDLAREAGAADPALLARQLHLLYDGTSQAVRMDRNLSAALEARAVASVLLDASLA